MPAQVPALFCFVMPGIVIRPRFSAYEFFISFSIGANACMRFRGTVVAQAEIGLNIWVFPFDLNGKNG